MTEKEIRVQKQVNDFIKQAEQFAKEPCCALCGNEVSSFKNSHTVPQFVLKRIAKEGKLKTFNDIVGQYEHRNGINNSWTFHILCSQCENSYFCDYEDETALLETPTNRMMAEIALKNSLLMLSKYRRDHFIHEEGIRVGMFVGDKSVLSEMNDIDIRDMKFDIRRSKKIIDKKLKSGYRLVYSTLLDWVAPIAYQSALCLHYDIDGNAINEIYDDSRAIRMQYLHVAVFPLSNKTAVMIFYHKDDRNYVSFERQFLRLPSEKKLEFINYLAFRYTEHMLLSPYIDPAILSNNNLVNLCLENDNMPVFENKPVSPNQVPNFLSKGYALEHPQLM